MSQARWALPLIGLVSLAVVAQDDQTVPSHPWPKKGRLVETGGVFSVVGCY
jgi:hypothetical protein